MTPADRIAQLEAELAEARADLDRVGANEHRIARELKEERAAHAATKATLADVEARLLAAQGEAAAMREAIKEEVLGDAYAEDWPQCVRALAADAGRAIAERVKLLEAVAVDTNALVEWALDWRTCNIGEKMRGMLESLREKLAALEKGTL